MTDQLLFMRMFWHITSIAYATRNTHIDTCPYSFLYICHCMYVVGMRHKADVGATILLRMQQSFHSAICGKHRQVFLEQSTDYHHDKRVNCGRGHCARVFGDWACLSNVMSRTRSLRRYLRIDCMVKTRSCGYTSNRLSLVGLCVGKIPCMGCAEMGSHVTVQHDTSLVVVGA